MRLTNLCRKKEKIMYRTKLIFAALLIAVATTPAFPQKGVGPSGGSPRPVDPLIHYPAASTNEYKAKEKKELLAQPDLSVKQFLFPPTNDKALRVHVVNTGTAASGACRLFLTVRKIGGASVGRQTHVNVPALRPGKDVWLVINAKSILPNNISLESTTFKLNVDSTEIVAESNEGNNEVWHNL
jgi:CARDB